MNNNRYLSTGELAKMLGVTKQTVIYYDKIGLISPIVRGDTKYRYYTLEQADELDSILTFRSLGVPINNLKEYLGDRNVEKCIELLRNQKEKIDSEIQKLDKIRKKIQGRQRVLEKVADVTDFEKVEFYTRDEEWFMIEPCTLKDEKSHLQSFLTICSRSKELQIDFENPICSIITKEELLSSDYKNVAFFGIKIPEEVRDEAGNCMMRPKGNYASTYHKGTYETMHLSYDRLRKAIEEEGYDICGNAYETDLFSILTNVDSGEYMKLISIQVCRKCE